MIGMEQPNLLLILIIAAVAGLAVYAYCQNDRCQKQDYYFRLMLEKTAMDNDALEAIKAMTREAQAAAAQAAAAPPQAAATQPEARVPEPTPMMK